ncbi:hypothetical protein EDB71_12211 [Vibrio crassostreae]|nr:hypothetical protein EDB71_12211 [Vibrio crassostreae]
MRFSSTWDKLAKKSHRESVKLTHFLLETILNSKLELVVLYERKYQP